jgi:hypothetical protein
MKKQLFLATITFLGAQATQAQVQLSVGPRVGLQSTSFDGPRFNDAAHTQRYGAQAGVVANAQFNHFAIQPALVFSQKGDRNDWRESDYLSMHDAVRINYLELPINFVLSLDKSDGFQLFAGPYVALGVGGRLRSTFTYESEVTESNDPLSFKQRSSYSNLHEFRRFDAGLNVGLGYKCGPLQIQTAYSTSAMTIKPESKLRSRSIQLSLNYFFALN